MSWKYVQRNEDGKYRTTDSGGGGGGGASALTDLNDVTITSPTNGAKLEYDSSNSVWINKNPNTTHLLHTETFEWKRGTSSATEVSLTYTAPSDGWIYAFLYIPNTGSIYICIDGWIYDDVLQSYMCLDNDGGKAQHHTWTVRFPAKKGDQIQIRTRMDSGTLPTDATFSFYG